MSDDYLAGPALLPDVTLMASWKDETTGKWKRRRVDLATLAAFILKGFTTNEADQNARLDALQASLQGFANAFQAEQAAVDRIAAQAAATDQTVAAITPRMTSLESRQASDAKALADQGARLATAEGTIGSQGASISRQGDRLTAAEGSITTQGKAITDQGTRLGKAETAITTQGQTLADQGARLTANETLDTTQSAKIKALEDKPEEVAWFSGSGRIPAITLGNTVILAVDVTPAKAGDVLKAGEGISVTPGGALPNGVNIAGAYVAADNKVSIQFTTGIAIALQSTATTFQVRALR